MSRRSERSKPAANYVAPPLSAIWHPSSELQGWQEDWSSDEEAAVPTKRVKTTTGSLAAAAVSTPNQTREEERRARKQTRKDALMKEARRVAAATPQSAEERRAELEQWIGENRNANTHAAYTSGWKQFVKWATESENAQRAGADEHVNVGHPNEADVAQYCKFIVIQKGCTMSSVQGAIAAIADHLRFKITKDYNPCQGPLVRQVCDVLKVKATPAQQKKEVMLEQVLAVVELAQEQGTIGAIRDACMIHLAYQTLLRASEVVRMTRGDITFRQELLGDKAVCVMHMFVNPLCKNDTERKGHTRCVQEQAAGPGARHCMVRQMRAWLNLTETRSTSEQTPLFEKATTGGGALASSTPNHRLRFWLEAIDVKDASEYGFHSLRAGGASAAARAGVHERDIMLHGNWKSSAVRVYIRPQMEERLAVSSALGAAAAAL